ncbi:C4-dicarboxylate transporter, DctM subunit [Roseivivax lentus]|uniref:TRAP transporter large permease protein n=1 Tax=Roseivivax lentus TaxID=633194 RepID=A0A1N7KS89_9RHOB|nr:TRAP transporter large permease [Roseivivax lentus]SIS64310.1 C4-dicarboxylate transporter, DctM subunit [Roseivivax lentus]
MPAILAMSLAFLLLLGVPVFIVLLLPVIGMLEFTTSTPQMLVIQRFFSGIDKFPLMAIPFFIFAGNLMAQGGMSRRLIDFASALMRPVTGGLGVTSVISSMFFSAISGSSPATVIAVGKTMLPAMTSRGYGRAFPIGILMSSGALGIIIPPSIFMIVYGAVTGASIGALFIAGIGAGLVYGVLFIIVAMIYAKAIGMQDAGAWDLREIAVSGRSCAWGLAAPVIILGGIYGGIFTPTEAAAVAVGYAVFVSMAVYREMSLEDVWHCAVDSAVTTAQVMIIIAAASVFAWYLTTSGVSRNVGAALSIFAENPVHLLLLINVIVLIAGMVLDPNSIIIILVPFIAPVALAAGIDATHLGIILAVNAAIGMFSPPFGLNLFVSVSLGVSYREAIIGALPFIAVGIAALLIITFVPEVTLWLPAQFYSGISY